MNKLELIRELRNLTQAGMNDCKSALEESGWDLQKAADIVKTKGLNNTSRSSGKIAAEGIIVNAGSTVLNDATEATMVEINCQTDFVANSPAFRSFAKLIGDRFVDLDFSHFNGILPDDLELARKELMAATKENIVVRRWWKMEVSPSAGVVATYLHSNSKIGVMVSLETSPSLLTTHSTEILRFGEDLAMQVAAMSPLSVSREQLPQEEVDRQKAIFETQLTELNKPQVAWPKIMEGKFNKWYSDVCLLDQESVITPKTSVGQLLKELSTKLGAEVKVLNFVRAVVGEGIEVQKTDLAADVANMIGE